MLDTRHQQCLQMHNVRNIQLCKETSMDISSSVPAMLFPRGSELYSLYTDTNGTTFVQTNNQDRVYFLQQHWTELEQIIQKDSMVLAIVYKNKQGELVMGIYDVLRASGENFTHYNIFDRQKHLFSMFAQNKHSRSIIPHWVGQEGSLLEHMQSFEFLTTLPFDIDYMLRINEATGATEQETIYNLVLCRELIPQHSIKENASFGTFPED
jgi:hypothetical protein